MALQGFSLQTPAPGLVAEEGTQLRLIPHTQKSFSITQKPCGTWQEPVYPEMRLSHRWSP